MIPKINTFPTTKFIGKNLSFTYVNYRAFELWSSFMPRRKEIQKLESKSAKWIANDALRELTSEKVYKRLK